MPAFNMFNAVCNLQFDKICYDTEEKFTSEVAYKV